MEGTQQFLMTISTPWYFEAASVNVTQWPVELKQTGDQDHSMLIIEF